MGRTQSTYLLQNYPGSSQPDYYPPHREHHHQGYHPSGGRGFEEQEDWSNGVPDQQGDYPADLGYYPKASSGQNPAFKGQPSHGGYHPQQQYHQQHFAGSSYIDQLSAQQQRYY